MGRPVVLSNGKLFVGLNEDGLVHDFYFPYVGLNNLATSRRISHKIGVWADGNFSWVDDGSWKISVNFEPQALISVITMHCAKLDVSLSFNDFVDVEHTAFIRQITVTNHLSIKRDIRIFMHQVFEISSDGRADTAMYVPDDHHLLTYKGRKCLLSAGLLDGQSGFDQFAVGNYGLEGKTGTFVDAEDGELSNNLVEHGGVDSVMRFQKTTDPQQSFVVDYWTIAARDHQSALKIHKELLASSISSRIEHTRNYYQNWLSPALDKIQQISEPYKSAVTKGLLIMKAHCDSNGSILASGDSSIFNYGRDYYCYCWPRDAAYTLWPMIRLGLYEEAKKFFDFAKGTIHPDGYMLHKYQPDRAVGSTWHSLVQNGQPELAIQEDETGCILFMLNEYFEASGDTELIHNYYDSLIKPAADFMSRFVDAETGLPHASYDLWEEKFLTTTYSVSMVIAGLRAASKLAELTDHPEDASLWKEVADIIYGNLSALYNPDGYFRKGYLLQPSGDLKYDETVDISSLQGVYMLAGLSHDDKRLNSTARKIEEKLLNTSPAGGVIRYEFDEYFRNKKQYPGNPWIVCTMWLAQYYAGTGQADKTKQLVDWALNLATPSGAFGEQFDPEDGRNLGVLPLVWSHAELINTILDLNKI